MVSPDEESLMVMKWVQPPQDALITRHPTTTDQLTAVSVIDPRSWIDLSLISFDWDLHLRKLT